MLIARNHDSIIKHMIIFPLIKNQNQMSIPAASFHLTVMKTKIEKTIGRSNDLQLSSQKLFIKGNEIS